MTSLDIYLACLTDIRSNALDYVGSVEFINFTKRRKVVEVLDAVQKWQSKPHNFARVEVIEAYLQKNMERIDEHGGREGELSARFMKLSREREPDGLDINVI